MIYVIIPTLDRFETLKRTVESLEESAGGVHFCYSIVIDGRPKHAGRCQSYFGTGKSERFPHLHNVFLNERRIGWGNSINRMIRSSIENTKDFGMEEAPGYFFSASDDLVFKPDTLIKAGQAMIRRFGHQGSDGVVGINQINLNHFCPAAFVLVGREFVNRFPDYQLYFPLYTHFCVDSELWHYAKSEGRFILEKRARVFHTRIHDGCHKLAQESLQLDRVIWWKKKGTPALYWPNDPDLEKWRRFIKRVKAEGVHIRYKKNRRGLGPGGVT